MNKDTIKAYYVTIFLLASLFLIIRFDQHHLFTIKIEHPVIVQQVSPPLSPYEQECRIFDREILADQDKINDIDNRNNGNNIGFNTETASINKDLETLYKERQDFIIKGKK